MVELMDHDTTTLLVSGVIVVDQHVCKKFHAFRASRKHFDVKNCTMVGGFLQNYNAQLTLILINFRNKCPILYTFSKKKSTKRIKNIESEEDL